MEDTHLNCIGCSSCSLSIFKDTPSDSLDSLQKNKITVRYKLGETLFHQGTPSFGVYCIERGKVKLSKVNQAGSETILSIASSGEIIGYQCNRLNPEYLATAKVLEACTACFIPNENLHRYLLSHPEVALNLLEQTMIRNEITSSYGHASIHMTAIGRVANLLVSLGNRFGVKTNESIKIDLRLTRQEMASMVGIASETVIRAITELKHQGILAQNGNFILIKDIDKLGRI